MNPWEPKSMNSSFAIRAAAPSADMAALAQACHALWMATLLLMTAFMQTPAPAHRLLLARRIARNFATLRGEPCFNSGTQASFARLQARWERKAQLLSPEGVQDEGAIGWLRRLLPR